LIFRLKEDIHVAVFQNRNNLLVQGEKNFIITTESNVDVVIKLRKSFG